MKDEPIEVLFYPVDIPKTPVRRLLAPDPESGLLKTMQNMVEVIYRGDSASGQCRASDCMR